MSDLTVFVVGDGERGRAVRDLVTAWTAEGICDSSVWVSPHGITQLDSGPPRVVAQVVSADGIDDDDLFRVVGRRRLEVVRVVVGQLILLGDEPDLELVEAGRIVADQIQRSLPRSNHDAEARNTRLHRANVMVPVSGAVSLDSRAVIGGWDVNAVVSAEDRPDIDRASVYVRHPGNFDGHAAAALAAVGAVLPGIPEGALEAIETDSTTFEDDLVLARFSVRAVIGDDTVRRLAAKALETTSTDPTGATGFVTWGRPAADPNRLVEDVVGHLTTSTPWVSGDPLEVPSAHRRVQGFAEAFADGARFNLRTFGTVAGWAFGASRSSLEESATGALVGHQGDTLVRLAPQTPAEIHAESVRWLADKSAIVRSSELEREAAAVSIPDPSTWKALRDVAFAVADGSALPDTIPEPQYAGVRELLPPVFVAPDPQQAFEVSSGKVLVAGDPIAVRTYDRELGTKISQAREEVAKAEVEIARAVAPVEQTADRSAPDATTTTTGKKDDAATEAPTSRQTGLDPKDVRFQARQQAQRRLADLQGEQRALATWVKGTSRSVLWRLADDVGRRMFDLQDRHDAARFDGSLEAPPHQELVAAQRNLVRWWRGTLLAWVVATLVAVALLLSNDADAQAWSVTLVALVVLAVVVLVTANHAFYKATRKYEWDVASVLDRRRRASEEFVFSGRESARLGQLYGTLVDWSQIIGWVLHHPWSAVSTEFTEMPDDVIESLPAAMGVAQPLDLDEMLPPATVVQAVRLLHRKGWNTTNFERAYERFRETHTIDDDAGYLAVDLDTLDSPLSPRRLLQDFWADGRAAEGLTSNAVSSVRGAVDEGALELSTRRVRRVGQYGDGETLSEVEFFHATVGEATSFVTDMFSPRGLQGRKHYTNRSTAWVPRAAGSATRADVTVRDAESYVALRVDLSRRSSPTDLALFHGAGAPPESGPAVSPVEREPDASVIADTWH